MENLHELALKHGTDKAASRRSLAAIYEPVLSSRRSAEIKLLEIGVLGGASLRMWRDYFPRRNFGIDKDMEARSYEGERVGVFIGDQADQSFLDHVTSITGPLTIVVDDGGHRAHQQIGSLLHSWSSVESGGIYIVEDTHTSYMDSFGMGWRQAGSTIEFLKGVVDDVHHDWHEHPEALTEVASISFYPETCILFKR